MYTNNTNLPYNVLKCTTHEEWLQARRDGIGSSEAGTLGCVNSFDTPIKLWQRKTGDYVPEKNDSKVLIAGHVFEPAVACLFAEATGAVIDRDSVGDWIAVDKEKPHLRVSPDRLFYLKGTPEEEQTWDKAYLLECKTTSKPVDPDDIPLYWFYQVQYQMRVLGIRRAVVAWISYAGGLDFGFTEVPYSPEFMAELESRIDTFWTENVLGGKCPEWVMDSEDAVTRWKTAAVDGNGDPRFVVADDRMIGLIAEYGDLFPKYKEMEERIDAIKLATQCYMGNAGQLRAADNTVLATWHNSTVAGRFNAKRFQADHPDLYAEYLGEASTSRRFLFK